MEWPEPTTDNAPAHPPTTAFMPALQSPWPDRGDAAGTHTGSIDIVQDGAFHPQKPPDQWNRLEAAFALAYRIVYCLVGTPYASTLIASEAVRVAASDETAPADLSSGVAGAAVDLVLAHHASLVEHGAMDPAQVSDVLHRTRLIRELRRWDPQSRTILALRHLDHRNPAEVAHCMALDESEVRDVTSQWLPVDARSGSEAMLKGIDAWIGGSFKGPQESTIGPLAVLDDPAATVPVIRSIDDLPGSSLPDSPIPGSPIPGDDDESEPESQAPAGGRLRHRVTR